MLIEDGVGLMIDSDRALRRGRGDVERLVSRAEGAGDIIGEWFEGCHSAKADGYEIRPCQRKGGGTQGCDAQVVDIRALFSIRCHLKANDVVAR